MNYLRLLNDNAAQRATHTCSVTNSSFPTLHLLRDTKSDFWRTTSTTAQLVSVFAANETISCVALPVTNLTAGATMRVRLYSDAGGTVQLLDTGTSACIPTREHPPANEILGANGFQYGFGRYATRYFAETSNVRCVRIDIVDSGNTLGFIESAFLIMGKYYSLERNFALGATLGWKSGSQLSNNDAGDSLVKIGWKRKALNFDLTGISETARSKFFNLLLGNGCEYPVFISAFPENTSLEKEEQFTIFGRLAPESELKLTTCIRFTNSIQLVSL